MIAQIVAQVGRDIRLLQDGVHHGADVEVAAAPGSRRIAMGSTQEKKGEGRKARETRSECSASACNESEGLREGLVHPAPISFAHKIQGSDKRRSKQLFDLQPAAKSR